MRYISGVHALNLPCKLHTTGDWHTSAIQWDHPHVRDTKTSFFGEWGIEDSHPIPCHDGTYSVANHLRACLDMLEEGDFSNLQGMYHDYIGTDEYIPLFFKKVLCMKKLSNWSEIDKFMEHEFLMKWINFKEGEEYHEH